MEFGVKTGREVGRRGQIRIGFVEVAMSTWIVNHSQWIQYIAGDRILPYPSLSLQTSYMDDPYLHNLCCPTPGTRCRCSLCSGNGVCALCPFCPYFQKAEPCLLCSWPLCLEWFSIGTVIAPQSSS